MDIFSINPPRNSFLRKLWVEIVYSIWLMNTFGWCDTYTHLCYHHNYKNQLIYHANLNDGREKGWSET